MNYAPIALFVYNRPQHTRQTVEALKKNLLAKESDLIVFSDAPKSEAQVSAVAEVRKYIREIEGFKSLVIVERDINYGLGRSVISGVSSILDQSSRIIVLEDDLIVASSFLEFMNNALDKYENDQDVVQISGYMFPVSINIDTDAFFLPLSTSWGWASWKRAWDRFDQEAKGIAKLRSDSGLRKRFNLGGAYDYYSMLEGQLAGRIDSWAVRWQLSVFLSGGLVLYPHYSLVVNRGFDGSGTHGVTRGLLSRAGTRDSFMPAHFPGKIAVNEAAWKVICESLRTRTSLPDRIVHRVRKLIKFMLARVKKN